MFLKKSLLFTTALALLMFMGQASAQPGVTLTHTSDTPGMVAGQGTTITINVAQTGISAIPQVATATSLNIDLAFDASLVSLTTPPGFVKADTETGATLTMLVPAGFSLSILLPPAVDVTFTTVADVTDMEFAIGIAGG